VIPVQQAGKLYYWAFDFPQVFPILTQIL
jgi:hypothetical protein